MHWLVFVLCICLGGASFIALAGDADDVTKQLNVYNWEGYFASNTLPRFEQQTGIKVNLTTFSDEDEMISALQNQPGIYDVSIASIHVALDLYQMRLIRGLDTADFPNIKHLDPQFADGPMHKYLKFGMPYMWGTTGILINRQYVTELNAGWNVMWNPAYKGKLAMLNNPEEVLSAALLACGYGGKSADPDELVAARTKLLKQRPLLAGYIDVSVIKKKMISNELWAAQMYSGDAVGATKRNDQLEYIIPQQGVMMWYDCLVIPTDAPNKENAVRFINYLLEPEVSAEISSELWFANCNKAAEQFMNPEVLQTKVLYPSDEMRKRCKSYLSRNFTPEQKQLFMRTFNKVWAELQHGQGE